MFYLFYISVLIVVYTYFIYPFILSFCKAPKKLQGHIITKVTVIIPAYNEINIIAEKILNTIAVCQKISAQIILVSNGSTDGTETYQHAGITHLHAKERKGKPEAINAALQIADGNIIVFTDANTLLSDGAMEKLLSHFENKNIGAVCGEKAFSRKHKEVAVENMYWKFESKLKQMEASCYSVVGAAGELFAIRKDLVTNIPENTILDDFYISMQVCKVGFKIGYEKDAKALEQPSLNLLDEYHRRVRIASGVMQWLLRFGIIDFWKYNIKLKWQFFSHRFCRWILAPLALLATVVIGSILGMEQPVYLYFILLYFLFAFLGFLFHRIHFHYPIFYYPFYFLFVHMTFVIGYVTYFLNKHTVLWHKAKRK